MCKNMYLFIYRKITCVYIYIVHGTTPNLVSIFCTKLFNFLLIITIVFSVAFFKTLLTQHVDVDIDAQFVNNPNDLQKQI